MLGKKLLKNKLKRYTVETGRSYRLLLDLSAEEKTKFTTKNFNMYTDTKKMMKKMMKNGLPQKRVWLLIVTFHLVSLSQRKIFLCRTVLHMLECL